MAEPASTVHEVESSTVVQRRAGVDGGFWKRISWGAILAGVAVTLALQLLMTMLGLGIGFYSIQPATEAEPLAGLGTGAAIWWVVTAALALFAGGAVASRLAGVGRNLDSVLHGVTMWSLVLLLTFYLATTAVGALVSGAARLVGQGLSTVASGAAALTPDSLPSLTISADGLGTTYARIRDEARTLLAQTGQPELQPEQLQQSADVVAEAATDAAADALRNPAAASQELDQALDVLFAQVGQAADAIDRQAVINVLTARTDMTEAEAGQVVDRWIAQAQQSRRELSQAAEHASQELQQLQRQVTQSVAEHAEAASETLASLSFWSAMMMVLGLVAAVGGGWCGGLRDPHLVD